MPNRIYLKIVAFVVLSDVFKTEKEVIKPLNV